MCGPSRSGPTWDIPRGLHKTSFGQGRTGPHGAPWGPTGHRGAPRGPVGPHGAPWGPTGPHTGLHGAPRGPWGLTGPRGAPWGRQPFEHGSPARLTPCAQTKGPLPPGFPCGPYGATTNLVRWVEQSFETLP